MGRLYVEVRSLWWADPSLSEAHGSKTIPVPRLWSHLLSLRSPRSAQEASPAGVSSVLQHLNGAELAPSFKPLLNRSFIFVMLRAILCIRLLPVLETMLIGRKSGTDGLYHASSYYRKIIIVQVQRHYGYYGEMLIVLWIWPLSIQNRMAFKFKAVGTFKSLSWFQAFSLSLISLYTSLSRLVLPSAGQRAHCASYSTTQTSKCTCSMSVASHTHNSDSFTPSPL